MPRPHQLTSAGEDPFPSRSMANSHSPFKEYQSWRRNCGRGKPRPYASTSSVEIAVRSIDDLASCNQRTHGTSVIPKRNIVMERYVAFGLRRTDGKPF